MIHLRSRSIDKASNLWNLKNLSGVSFDAVANTICGSCMFATHSLRSNAVTSLVNHP